MLPGLGWSWFAPHQLAAPAAASAQASAARGILTLLLLFAFTSLILVAVAIPLARGKIKPNPWYGFRVAQTLRDLDLWQQVNIYFGRLLIAAGLWRFAVSVLLYFWPGIDLATYAIITGALIVGSLIFATWQSWRYIKSLAR